MTETHSQSCSLSNDQTKLIINYLPYSMTKYELAELFGSIGPVQSAKVVCDHSTGTSLGFGFVEYEDPKDAAHAISKFDGMLLQSKRLKVGYSLVTEGRREGANVHVRNLDPKVSVSDVEEQFGQYGELIRARVLNDPVTGLSRCIAFVLFVNRQDAEAAISKLHGVVIPGFSSKPLCVRFALDSSTKSKLLATHGSLGPRPAINFHPPTAYGFGAEYGASHGGGPVRAGAANQRFNPMGLPSAVDYVMDPYASASMCDSNFIKQVALEVSAAFMGLRGQNPYLPRPPIRPQHMAAAVSNTRLPSRFEKAASQSVAMQSKTSQLLPGEAVSGGHIIFIYNLEPNTMDSDLWQLFGPFGAVMKVDVIYEKDTTKCKGYGFVTMRDLQEAHEAIQYLNGFTYKDRVLQVSLKK